MFDQLVRLQPREGDLVIIRDGHFVMAIALDFEQEITVYDDSHEYFEMTGLEFTDFVDSTCVGMALNNAYCFYWFDA